MVKAVISGDTLVLVGRSKGGPPPELQLSLSGVLAPKLARGPSSAPDEAFAWESREFLRKLVLGKSVQFRQEGSKNSRNYGSVWIGSPTAENVAILCVKAGWCVPSGVEEGELAAAAAEAREAGKGAHSTDRSNAVRSVKWSVDAQTTRDSLLGHTKKALIEYVKDGSNYRCMLLPEMWVVSVSLAGVRCGRVNRVAAPPPPAASSTADEGAAAASATPPAPPAQPAEPFAEEAKFFVESRLLHREVELHFASVDKFGNALCTVGHSAGSIAIELVKNGLGRVAEPGMTNVDPAHATKLRQAEKQAKAAKLRYWRGYEAPKVSGDREYDVVVVEALSGDQIAVQRWGDEKAPETRIALSSVRAPRMPNPRAQRAGEPWAVEARDALRKACVGKRCRVKIEYSRDIPGAPAAAPSTSDANADKATTTTRVFASVSLATKGGDGATKDVAEMLVGDGLLSVVPPRSTEERAERFDELSAAEKRAVARKVGLHSSKSPPPPARTTDLAGDAKRARAFLPYLKRQKSHKAFVEAVFTGSRFKLRFSGENCALVFSLSSCRSPAPSTAARSSAESGGEAAKAFARRSLLQRVVEASVEDMDRNGVALGSITLVDSKESYESRLISRGLAKVDRRRLDQHLPGSEMGIKFASWASLEATARKNREGLWADQANVDEFEKAQNEAVATTGTFEETKWTARMADIVDGGKCYLHETTGGDAESKGGAAPKAARFEAIASKMKEVFKPSAAKSDAKFRRNAMVAALFDGEWCRAKILEGPSASGYSIAYIDYGNRESNVPASRLRPLLEHALTTPAPTAIECELAYLSVASLEDDAGQQAARTLHSLAWDKALDVKQHGVTQEGGKRRVVLAVSGKSSDEESQSINEQLVELGLARVPSAAKRDAARCTQGPEFLAKLTKLEEKARASRSGLWRYGDVDYSDDEGI